MSSEHPGDSDLDVECQFYVEYADALSSLSNRYRVLADVLPGLGPADRDRVRAEVRGITRRTIGAATITLAILDGTPLTQTEET